MPGCFSKIGFIFFVGILMVRSTPLISHPSISCWVSQIPSALSYFLESGPPSGDCDSSSGVNTFSIVVRRVREMRLRSPTSVACAMAIKSPT